MKPITIAVSLFLIASSPAWAGHSGPKYPGIPSGCVMDAGSSTSDNSNGLTVSWTDRLNKQHSVSMAKPEEANKSITVVFPIPHGGEWRWNDGDWEKTGCNGAASWIETTFRKTGPQKLTFNTTCHRCEPADPGTWGEIKDRIKDVKEIAELGAQTGSEAAGIAKAAGLMK